MSIFHWQLRPFAAGIGLFLVGALMLTAVVAVVAVRGWPAPRGAASTRPVVLSVPAPSEIAPQVVLGGGAAVEGRAAAVPEAGAPAAAEDRSGVARAADDVVSALDDVLP